MTIGNKHKMRIAIEGLKDIRREALNRAVRDYLIFDNKEKLAEALEEIESEYCLGVSKIHKAFSEM